MEKNRERLTEFCVHHAASRIVLLLLGRKSGIKSSIYNNCIRFLTMPLWRTGVGFCVFNEWASNHPDQYMFQHLIGLYPHNHGMEWMFHKRNIMRDLSWILLWDSKREKKAVRDVNRIEAPNKAKLTESVKKLSFSSTLFDKSFSPFIAILLFYYKDHLHRGIQRVHHLPHHCCDSSYCIQVNVSSNLDSFTSS